MFPKLLVKRHIASLDLDSVRLKAINDLGWSSEKTTQIELEYRRFLYALAKKPEEYSISPPSHDVDEFWHRHILDTRKYREHCDLVFGHYMDHTPGLSSAQQAAADARRQQVYAEHEIDFLYFETEDRRDRYRGGGDGDGGDGGDGGSSDGPHHAHSGHHGDAHSGGHDGASADGGHSSGDGGSDGGGSDGGGGDGGGCGGGSCGGGCGGGCGG